MSKILIKGREGAGKTWLVRDIINDILEEEKINMLAYTDMHEGEVEEFGDMFEGKVSLLITLGEDKKEVILDTFLSEQKRDNHSLEVAIFDECGYFEGEQREKLIKLLENADEHNQTIILTYQHEEKKPIHDIEKYCDTFIELDKYSKYSHEYTVTTVD